MAGGDQVLGGKRATLHVVDRDHITRVARARHKDDWNPLLDSFAHGARFAGEGEKDDSRDPVLEQRLDTFDLTLAVAFGVAEHCGVAARRGVSFDHLGHLGKEGIEKIADHDSQDFSAPLDQLSRYYIRPVAKAFDRGANPATSRFRHTCRVANYVRDRRLRDAGFQGNVEDRGRRTK